MIKTLISRIRLPNFRLKFKIWVLCRVNWILVSKNLQDFKFKLRLWINKFLLLRILPNNYNNVLPNLMNSKPLLITYRVSCRIFQVSKLPSLTFKMIRKLYKIKFHLSTSKFNKVVNLRLNWMLVLPRLPICNPR